MPVQSGADNLIQRGMPRLPSQEFLSSGSEGHKFGGIARPAPRFPERHPATARSLHCRDNFANRVPAPGAQVQRSTLLPFEQVQEPEDMCFGQVCDVDVVSDRCAIGCGIVRAINFQIGSFSKSSLNRERDEMRLRLMGLADFTLWVSACRIEIPQGKPAQPVRFAIPVQNALDYALRFSVGVDGILKVVLWNGGAVGNPVSCAAGRKDNVLYAGVQHGIEESQRVGHIVAEVLARTFHGLADISARGEVDYGAHMVVFERIAN